MRASIGLLLGGLLLLAPLIPGRSPLLLVGLAVVGLVAAYLRRDPA